ncbi:hypothetical protein HRbin40_02605 [bacterium HR40]|nr:hypothetical protein HRbin40_02605 [bacterium HR40]
MGSTTGRATVAVRALGWSVIAVLAAFLVNSGLSFVAGWPGSAAVAGGTGRAWLQLLLYPAAILVALVHVLRSREVSLRHDSARIAQFVSWLVRCGFFAVLLVGIVDAALSFLRVEGWLPRLLGETLATDLGRPHYRGAVVHLPLLVAGFVVGTLVRRTPAFHWLALLVVVAELLIVFARFVFSYEQAFMADLVRFWYGALFLFASARTLAEEGHVRVDVFYMRMDRRQRGAINAIGTILLGMSFCWTILLVGFANRSAVIASPLFNFEISQSGFGMYVKYLMAGFLAFFAVTMLLQFVAYLFDAVADWRGEPGGHSQPSAHVA